MLNEQHAHKPHVAFAHLEIPHWMLAIASWQELCRLGSGVDILEEAAQGVIIHSSGVVCSMLLQRLIPEAAADLIATLADLNGHKLSGHA
jgi:hypothetical protein